MRLALSLLASLLVIGCGDSASGTGGSPVGGSGAGGGNVGAGDVGGGGDVGGSGSQCPADIDLAEENLGGGADPEEGDFTIDEALADLPEGPGPLRAIITTSMGEIRCELFPDSAPYGVANFVGLARGRRPFKEGADWIKGRRFYDGLIFHRVIDDFMAQTGDPLGTGFGGPGYQFDAEIDPSQSHTPGTLSYAHAQSINSNGSQFYIVAETGADFLDGNYVIFGRCSEVDVVKAISEVPTDGDPPAGGNKPLADVTMSSVTITRCAE
jgi:peptidyl-prolyl cis-trans isomerase A (cyclophilin A)